MALIVNAGKHIARIILGRNRHHHAGIGIAFGARILAHAIGHHPPGLTGGGHHGAAGAHAETIDRAAILRVMHQLVIRRTQKRIASIGAKTRAVNHALRVFNAHTDGKGLGLHGNTMRLQHGEAIACAMAKGEYRVVRFNHLSALKHKAAQVARTIGAGFDDQVIHPRTKAIFTAQGFDLRTDMFHHGNQPKRADMRLGDIENLLRRAGLHKFRQHLAPVMARVADLAIELAIGKSASATFAILHIAFRVQHAAPPQAPGILGAFAHHLAAFQDQRAEAHLCQQQRRHKAARPGANHYRATHAFWRARHKAIGGIRRGADALIACVARQNSGLISHFNIQRIDQHDRLGLARIIAAAKDMHRLQRRIANAKPHQHGGAQGVFRMVQRQAQFSQADHGRSIVRLAACLKSSPASDKHGGWLIFFASANPCWNSTPRNRARMAGALTWKAMGEIPPTPPSQPRGRGLR